MVKLATVTAWDRVKIAREADRPTALDYIENIFDEFMELHGDRYFKDDKSIVCGLGNIGKQNYTIIGEQKGRNTKENIERNFGMPNPEAYRKALRFMKQAEKFRKTYCYIYRHKRSIPWTWSRGKRTRRSYCKKLNGNVRFKSSYYSNSNR